MLLDFPFAERLKIARHKKRLSQQELGDLVGYSGRYISACEKGRSTPPMRKFLFLCNALEVSADWLLGREMGK